jgi:hypothetical protein
MTPSSTAPAMALALSEMLWQYSGFARGSMSPIFKPAVTAVPGRMRPRRTPLIAHFTRCSETRPITSFS